MVNVTLYKHEINRRANTFGVLLQTVDVTNYIFADTLKINWQADLSKIFEYVAGSASFEVHKDANVNNILDATELADNSKVVLVHISDDGVGKFWGYLGRDSVNFDETNERYSFDITDIYALYYKNLSTLRFVESYYAKNGGYRYNPTSLVRTLSTTQPTLYNWLDRFHTLPTNYVVGDRKIISLFDGGTGIWNITDFLRICNIYGTQYADSDGWINSDTQPNDLKVGEFQDEVMKHYNANVMVNGNGQLVFWNRNRFVGATIDITNDVIDADREESADPLRVYDGILVNAKGTFLEFGSGVFRTFEGWLYIIGIPLGYGVYGNIFVDENLLGIPSTDSYLDVRQRLQDKTTLALKTEYLIFPPRDENTLYSDYGDLLNVTKAKKVTVLRTDIEPSNQILLHNRYYAITKLGIDYSNRSTQLELLKIGN